MNTIHTLPTHETAVLSSGQAATAKQLHVWFQPCFYLGGADGVRIPQTDAGDAMLQYYIRRTIGRPLPWLPSRHGNAMRLCAYITKREWSALLYGKGFAHVKQMWRDDTTDGLRLAAINGWWEELYNCWH